MWIEVIIPSNPYLYSLHLKFAIKRELHCCEATTKAGKSLRFTVFTTNVCVNTEMPTFGSILLIFSTTFLSPR